MASNEIRKQVSHTLMVNSFINVIIKMYTICIVWFNFISGTHYFQIGA